MDRPYVYQNAPLQEVILEYHWELENISIAPGAAIDRFWQSLSSHLAVEMQKKGFEISEPVVPNQIPIELLARQVVRRFRKQSNKWPVYQVGPGVFTANIIPPYNGWQDFRRVIDVGTSMLLEAYPDAKRQLNFERISVRYLNFFGKNHNVENPAIFIRDRLNLGVALPEEIAGIAGEQRDQILTSGTVTIPVQALDEGQGQIVWQEGSRNNQSGVFLEFRVNANLRSRPHSKRALGAIADSCHDVIADWFESLVAKQLGDVLGEKRNVRK